jgi:hypothetical protein
MADTLCILASLAFFLLAAAYTRGCDQLAVKVKP